MSRGRADAECPRNCPRRSASPNCHDPETCAVWAAYMARMETIRAGKKRAEASVMTVGRLRAERRKEQYDRRHGRYQ